MRALVLSGGGARGAYQVGVVKALTESGARWDMISGISVGALNGTLLAHYSDPKEGIVQLEKFWLDLKGNKSVYKQWWCGLLGSFFYGGAFNTAPLRKLVEDNLDQEKLKNSGIQLRIGSVCLETGGYMIATQNAQNLSQWVMASSAFPVAFPPEKLLGFNFIDGGVRNIVPLQEVLEDGATEVDIVLASPADYVPVWDSKKVNNALLVGSRCIDLMSSEILANDVIKNSKAIIRIHSPSLSMPLQNPLTFDPKEIRTAIDLGYKKTKSTYDERRTQEPEILF